MGYRSLLCARRLRGGGVPDYTQGLNDNGKAIFELLQTRPTWSAELEEIAEDGTPLLNEAVFSCLIGEEPMVYAVVPVASGGEIDHLAMFEVNLADSTRTTRRTSAPLVEAPEVVDESMAAENPIARSLIDSKTAEEWKKNGYELTFKRPKLEPEHQHVATRSSSNTDYEVSGYCYHPFSIMIVFRMNYRWVNFERCITVDTYNGMVRVMNAVCNIMLSYHGYLGGGQMYDLVPYLALPSEMKQSNVGYWLPNRYDNLKALRVSQPQSTWEDCGFVQSAFRQLYDDVYMVVMSQIGPDVHVLEVNLEHYESYCYHPKVFYGENDNDDDDDDDDLRFMVDLYAMPTQGAMILSGQGMYKPSDAVFLQAHPNAGWQFVDWTSGGAIVSTSPLYTTSVFQNKQFIANFRPCYAPDKTNPVGKMQLAPPNPYNIPGATWGMTRHDRYGQPKKHDGVDLAAEVGTPVYAQFDGTVGKAVYDQPNRVPVNGEMQYPPGYVGDRNDGGNRITINSTVSGQTVSNSYWHLREGTPIANNPRTGRPWTTGDQILKGELVGFTGITGNANAGVPHLHLNTKKNGVSSNPADYLKATITTTSTTITTPCG